MTWRSGYGAGCRRNTRPGRLIRRCSSCSRRCSRWASTRKTCSGKADQQISQLQQQLAAAQITGKDKDAGNAIADYEAETKRLQAVAQADPAAAQVIIRSMLSQLLGMPALPIMHEHQEADAMHQQAIAPPPMPEAGAADQRRQRTGGAGAVSDANRRLDWLNYRPAGTVWPVGPATAAPWTAA